VGERIYWSLWQHSAEGEERIRIDILSWHHHLLYPPCTNLHLPEAAFKSSHTL